MTEKRKPIIAVTMGDAAGIGPEITLRALTDPVVREAADCVLVGDLACARRAAALVGTDVPLREIAEVADARFDGRAIPVIDTHSLVSPPPYGQVNAACGQAAYDFIARAARLCADGGCDAVATAPIHKEALRLAGVPYIGHTEIFGALTGTPDPLTVFETDGMRIFFLTRHIPFRRIADAVTEDAIHACALRCLAVLRRLGAAADDRAPLAVAGLNPHCGEHGLFGDEEERQIVPAVARLRAEGYAVVGPVGADSVFAQARAGRYAGVLSLYHDQGHIAAKTVDFDRTVSLTGGMPILRTSVDHGTAFDIAGRGIARHAGMAEAITVAARYAPFYRKLQ